MKKPTLADLEAKVRDVGGTLSKVFPAAEGYGYALLTFNFGDGGHMTYHSNAKREDMIEALEEMVVRLKTGTVAPHGAPDHPSNKMGKA